MADDDYLINLSQPIEKGAVAPDYLLAVLDKLVIAFRNDGENAVLRHVDCGLPICAGLPVALRQASHADSWPVAQDQLLSLVLPAAVDVDDVLHMVQVLNELGVVEAKDLAAWREQALERPIPGPDGQLVYPSAERGLQVVRNC